MPTRRSRRCCKATAIPASLGTAYIRRSPARNFRCSRLIGQSLQRKGLIMNVLTSWPWRSCLAPADKTGDLNESHQIMTADRLSKNRVAHAPSPVLLKLDTAGAAVPHGHRKMKLAHYQQL